MVTVLGLSAETHGNGVGIGSAVAVPKSMVESLDLQAMYINSITSTVLTTVRIPMIMKNQRECVQVALRCCTNIDKNAPRIARISDTLHLEHIWLSQAYMPEISAHAHLTVQSGPQPWNFDRGGNLF
jgi:hypothetical protein